jgi:hypothetical protein
MLIPRGSLMTNFRLVSRSERSARLRSVRTVMMGTHC